MFRPQVLPGVVGCSAVIQIESTFSPRIGQGSVLVHLTVFTSVLPFSSFSSQDFSCFNAKGTLRFELVTLFQPREMILWSGAQNQGTCCTQVNGSVSQQNRQREPGPAVLGSLGKAVGLKGNIDCVSQGKNTGYLLRSVPGALPVEPWLESELAFLQSFVIPGIAGVSRSSARTFALQH